MNFNGQSEPKGGHMVGSPTPRRSCIALQKSSSDRTNNNFTTTRDEDRVQMNLRFTSGANMDKLSVEVPKTKVRFNFLTVNKYFTLSSDMRKYCINKKLSDQHIKLLSYARVTQPTDAHDLLKWNRMSRHCRQKINSFYIQIFDSFDNFEFQSGEMNPKQLARSLYKNSTASTNKARERSRKRNGETNIKLKQRDHKTKQKLHVFCNNLQKQAGWKTIYKSRDIGCHIENIISYIVAIKDCVSMSQFVGITNLFLGCYFDSSRVAVIIKYFTRLFSKHMFDYLDNYDVNEPNWFKQRIYNAYETIEETLTSNTGYFGEDFLVENVLGEYSVIDKAPGAYNPGLDDESSIESDFELQAGVLNDIKGLFSNYKELKNCETAKKFHKFISYVLTLGLCGANQISFSLGRFELFHASCLERAPTFIDIIESCFDIIIYFVERGHQAFVTGDPWCLLYGDNAIIEYEKNFSYINSFVAVVESGNLEHLKESVDSFEDKVTSLKEETLKMMKHCTTPSIKQVLVQKLNVIDKINVRLLQARKNVSIREKPYSFLLFGGSSVGKSAMTNIILNQLMQVNGFDPDPKKINSLNASDQYQSDYRSDATCVIFDDLANSTLQTTKGNHCQLIIDFINNNPKCALKAGVEEKGAVPIRPKIVVGTTNVKTLLAHQYSNEPLSIVRRFDVTITVTVKPEFCQNGSTMIDPAKIPFGERDCWAFRVEKVQPVFRGEGAVQGIGYEPVMYEGKQLVDINMKELLDYLTYASKLHFSQQKELITSSHSVFTTEICKHCSRYPEWCECLSTQVRPITEEMLEHAFDFTPPPEPKPNIFAPPAVVSLYGISDNIICFYDRIKAFTNFIGNLGEYVGIDNLVVFHRFIRKKWPTITYVVVWPALFCMSLLGLTMSATYCFFFFSMTIIQFLKSFNWLVETKLKFISIQTNSLLYLKKLDNDRNRKIIKIGAIGIVSAITLKKIYDLLRTYNVLKFQGSECRTPEPQPDEKPDNEWKKPYMCPVPKSTKSWTTTSTALAKMVSDNLAYFEYTVSNTGRTYCSCAFPLKSNVWIINNHALEGADELSVKFVRHSPSLQGGNFSTTISSFLSVHIPNTDLTLVYVPSGGDNKDMTAYFPLEFKNSKMPAKLIYKDENANVNIQLVNAQPGIVGTPDIQILGYQYKTEIPTKKGHCMSTLVADEIGPIILGFHFAGISGKTVGASSTVTQAQLNEACRILALKPSVVLSHNTGDLELRDVGPYKNVKVLPTIHDHSPLNFQPEGATFRAFGKHDGARKTYKSDVEPTLISDSVHSIMGQPNIWGPPPNLKGWETWQRDLSNMTHPKELCPTILVCATKDYQTTIINSISVERLNRIYPLSDESALAGADGVYGIDSVNMKSSCGAPINKPKNKILERSVIPIKGISQPIIAPDYIWKEVEILSKKLLKKERVYVQFSACLKDEPTKITKLKTRVFCGSPIAATILIRKYYLPFCKLIMENHKSFECAVGINAHGKDWDDLTKHIIRFGENRMVAGDYSDYDSTMPSSIMLASFGIIIELARRAGYSNDQITIMEGLATEMCYPIYEYNGEFIQIQGSNPSGHPLTVFINSMCNSLFMRYAYYHIYPFDNKTLFQDYVSLMTYGDDNIMSVSVERPEFNHTRIAEVLASSDIKYTMADKSAISRAFISLDEVSFLKRSFKWSEEFQLYLAPIEELSLFKTLHSALKSKELSREQHSAQAIDCVLREWFYFGEPYFNEKREQLVEVAKKHQLLHHFENSELHTYESLKCSFIEKHLTEDVNRESDPHVGEPSVGYPLTLIP